VVNTADIGEAKKIHVPFSVRTWHWHCLMTRH